MKNTFWVFQLLAAASPVNPFPTVNTSSAEPFLVKRDAYGVRGNPALFKLILNNTLAVHVL